jgi:hypothetical protein
MKKSPYYALILIFISLGMASCSAVARPEQLAHETLISLSNGNSIGQTFFARFRGLSGIEIFIDPEESTEGELTLSLLNGTQDDTVLAEAKLPAAKITHPDFYRLEFPAQIDSTNHDYYVRMSLSGKGPVEIGAGSGEAYLDGALYQNDVPQDNQLAFRLVYDPYQASIGLLLMMFSWLGILAIAGFLYILPGWAALGYLESDWDKRSWGEKLGLSAGMSLAIYPILFLWTHLIGLNLGPVYAWFPPILGLGLIAWRSRRWRPSSRSAGKITIKSLGLHAVNPANGLYLFILALIFATRFWVIRNLSIPLWGDSYQHTMIAQLLVDHNGLFNSWEPYADLQTFTYHFGFHTFVAVFHWVSNFSMPSATLWTGQILNGLAILVLYPLAVKVAKNPWAGVLAVLLAGMLSPIPMYYVNWGRYTQLAGQAILPVAAVILWEISEERQDRWALIALGSISMAGLALTHYRVLVFGILFIVPLMLLNLRSKRGNFVSTFSGLAWAGIGAGMLFLPWFIHVFRGKLFQIFLGQVTTPAGQLSAFAQQYNAIGDLFTFLPPMMWLLLPLAIGFGFWRQEKDFAIVALWWFLVLLSANPQWFNLPGAGSITNSAVFMAAYLPVSILLGAAISWLLGAVDIKETKEFSWGLAGISIMAVGLGLWGASLRIKDLNLADHALVTRPDLRAAEWIRENTSNDARFLVNSFFAYGDSSVVGSDGGWWLPLLSLRQTTLPPLTYSSERGARPNYQEWINSLPAEILDQGVEDPDVLMKLSKRGVTYIYIGQQQGLVNYSGPTLDPKTLMSSNHFREIYNQDRVWIFEIRNQNQVLQKLLICSQGIVDHCF